MMRFFDPKREFDIEKNSILTGTTIEYSKEVKKHRELS